MRCPRSSALRLLPILVLLLASRLPAQWSNPYTGHSFNNPMSSTMDTLILHSMQRTMLEKSIAAQAERAAKGRSKTRFQPSGTRLMVEPFVDSMAQTPEMKEGLRQVFKAVFEAFEPAAAAAHAENDVAAAIAFYLQVNYSVFHDGEEIGDPASDALLAQCQEAFATPELAAAADADKQKLYETFVLLAGLTSAGYQQAVEQQDQAQRKTMIESGGQGLAYLLKVEPGRIVIGEKGMSIRPAPVAAAPATVPAPGKAAAGDGGPAADVGLGGERTSWNDYGFIMPPGMTSTQYTDGLGLQLPLKPGEGSCMITLLPLRPAQGALDAQALAILLAFFEGRYAAFGDEQGGRDPLRFQWRGVTGQGHEYVELPYCSPIGADGHEAPGWARILLVKVGDQVAPVVGFEGTTGHCLDEPGYLWRRFFHSLRFATAADPNPYAKAVVGRWSAGGASDMSATEFKADGTGMASGGYQSTRAITDTLAKETTTTFAGGLHWTVHGNRLTKTPDGGRPPGTAWIRIASQPNSSVPGGWMTVLFELEKGYDGNIFEVGLHRQD